MADFVQFTFDDGTSVLMEAFPADRLGGLARPDRRNPAGDLPPGSAPIDPVSRAGEILEKAGHALSEVLHPLVPVLEAVHRTVSTASEPPDEVTVQLGLKISSDLHLMVVGGGGEASITVSAKWDLRRP